MGKKEKMKNKMNKRADVAVTLLVVLVVLLTITTLYTFGKSSKKIQAEISGWGVVEKAVLRGNVWEFYTSQVVEVALVKTYQEFVEEHKGQYDFIDSRTSNNDFKNLHPNLNENFVEKYKNNLIIEFAKYEFEDFSFRGFVAAIRQKSFTTSFDGGFLIFEKSDLKFHEFNENKENVLEYYPKIKVEFNLTRIGLHDFNDIYSVKQNCISKENLKECYEQGLFNFDVEVNEKRVVTLTTKKKFFIEGEFKKISFSFIPR